VKRTLEGVAAFGLIVAGVCWLVSIPVGLIAAGLLLIIDLLT
jgi:hypothetical protein